MNKKNRQKQRLQWIHVRNGTDAVETDWDVVFVGTAFKQYQIRLTFGNGTWLGPKCQGSLTWFHSSESMEQCLFDLVRLSTGLGKHVNKNNILGKKHPF